MRKAIYIPLILLLGACTATEDPAVGNDLSENGETAVYSSSMRLGVKLNATTASGAPTPRELTNADSTQLVQSVTLYLFRSDTKDGVYKWYKPTIANEVKNHIELSSFEKDEEWEMYDPDEQHPYWCRDWNIADGWYKVVAVGRDDRFASNPSAMSPWMDIPQNVWNDGISLENAYISICDNADKATEPLRAAELFVGVSEAVVGQGENVECEVVLSRRVAGMVMHISSIPQTIDGSTVKSVGIVASKATPGVLLDSKAPYGGEIALSDYTTTCLMRKDIPASATVDATTGLYENVNTTDSDLPEDTLFKGAFITPQGDITLYVVAWDGNGYPIKRWPVKLIDDSGQLDTYPLIANHYYEIDVSVKDLRDGKVVALGEYYGHVYVPL